MIFIKLGSNDGEWKLFWSSVIGLAHDVRVIE